MDRLLAGKCQPTTKITIGDMDWTGPTTLVIVRASSESTPPATRLRAPHGLLTPQESKDDVFGEGHNASQTGSSREHTEMSSHAACTTNKVTCMQNSESICDTLSVELNDARIQTSLASVSTPYVLECTPPPSPASQSPSDTPKARRKIKSKAFIFEGERQARELEDDLRHIARRREALERKLKKVQRQERDLQSFLISSPIDYPNSDAETEIVESDDDESVESSREPQTPAKTDVPMRTVARGVRKSASAAVPSTPSRPPRSGVASRLGASMTMPVQANATSEVDRVSSIGFVYSEATSVSDGLSIRNGAQSLCSELGPEPIRDPSNYLVWLDLETNDAIRPAKNIRILEIALCITDKNYVKLDGGISYLVHWPMTAEEVAADMPSVVVQMHNKSGLLADYGRAPPSERRTLEHVEKCVCKYLESHDIKPGSRALMAGAGIAFDRGIVRQHMPKLDTYFGHQIFDVTTIWHFVRRKYGRRKRHQEECAHRALADVMGSIKEAKMYSKTVLKNARDVQWPSA